MYSREAGYKYGKRIHPPAIISRRLASPSRDQSGYTDTNTQVGNAKVISKFSLWENKIFSITSFCVQNLYDLPMIAFEAKTLRNPGPIKIRVRNAPKMDRAGK